MADLVERLRSALREPLPGGAAHSFMAFEPPPADARRPRVVREAAVMVLLYPHDVERDDRWSFALIRRGHTGSRYDGHVALPGGHREEGEDLALTALRETEEEIGVPRERVGLVGRLTSLVIAECACAVHPFVGQMSERPDFAPCPREVAEVIEAPLQALPTANVDDPRCDSNPAPRAFDLAGHRVWGATGMIVNELAWVLQVAGLVPLGRLPGRVVGTGAPTPRNAQPARW